MQTVTRNPEVAERHVERDRVEGRDGGELRSHLPRHLKVDGCATREPQRTGEPAGVGVERDEQLGAADSAPQAKVSAIVGPNEPPQEQKPPLDCRARVGVRGKILLTFY